MPRFLALSRQILSSVAWLAYGAVAQLLRLEPRLWRKRCHLRMVSESWQVALSEVEAAGPFFRAVPYRPDYRNPFDQERQIISAALAVANAHYFRGDLSAYRYTVGRIGEYLEHARLTEKAEVDSSDVWVKYLHHKATLELLFGESSRAAVLNAEAQRLSARKHGRTLTACGLEGCAMCCRVESLSPDEDHLFHAIDSRITDLYARLQRLSGEKSGHEDLADLHTEAFYISMIRCKAQAHARNPDAEAIEAAIQQAQRSRPFMDGPETKTYDVVVPFYEAFLSKLTRQSVAHTTAMYDRALAGAEKLGAPYHCLLRVPDTVSGELANHVQRKRLVRITPLVSLRKSKTAQFIRNVVGIVAAGSLLLFVLTYYALLVPPQANATDLRRAREMAIGISLMIISAGLAILKRVAEREDRGIVSPPVLNAVEIACGLTLALAVAFLSAAATEGIGSPL